MKPSLAIVGCGTVGTAMGKLLSDAGYRVMGVVSRRLETARKAARTIGVSTYSTNPWEVTKEADIIFITTPDKAITPTCEAIVNHKGFKKGAVVIHCSGAHSSDILSSARRLEAYVASLHPLQSFASVDQALKIVHGSVCTIEGDEPALHVVRQLVSDLGGILVEISPKGKTLYHAAAVTASNYLVTLIDMALQLNGAIGIARETSFKALFPLIKGTLKNIEAIGIPAALTGPIARGDIDTVTDHLNAIKKDVPELIPLYKTLGLFTVNIAVAKGTLSPEIAHKMALLFKE
nr:DUF2520 domain-containing protein [Desulfobacterales bacterium]